MAAVSFDPSSAAAAISFEAVGPPKSKYGIEALGRSMITVAARIPVRLSMRSSQNSPSRVHPSSDESNVLLASGIGAAREEGLLQ